MSPPRFRRASRSPRSRSPSTALRKLPNKSPNKSRNNSRNKPLQKQSNGNVQVWVQPHPSYRRIAGDRDNRERMLVDRSAVADRRKAEADRDRKSDGAARLQAGADADAETGDCVVQRQFAVAERLPGVLQGSARGADRRHLDGDGEYHRQGEHRQRDPAQPHQQGRFRHHRFCRQPDAGRAGAENPAGPAVDGGLDRFQRRQGFGQPPGGDADQRRRRGDAVAAERQSRGRRQAGDPGQFRNPRTDRRRHRAAGGHPERQHHRFEQDRAGPHRLWRPRPDHRHPAAALRPTSDGRAAAVLKNSPPPEKGRVREGIKARRKSPPVSRAPTSHREPRRDAMYYTASVSSPGGGRGRLGGRLARGEGLRSIGNRAKPEAPRIHGSNLVEYGDLVEYAEPLVAP